MAKELFAGQKKSKYRIVISKEGISKKNIVPLLKMHKKTLIISDDGVPQKIVKKVETVSKSSTKIFKIIVIYLIIVCFYIISVNSKTREIKD